jgi:hypothetical protein
LLAEKGAYGEDMKYTVEDVKRIIEFAMSRGVRVVPEIDSPGKHSPLCFPASSASSWALLSTGQFLVF